METFKIVWSKFKLHWFSSHVSLNLKKNILEYYENFKKVIKQTKIEKNDAVNIISL